MEINTDSDPSRNEVLQKFENLYGTLKKFRKTETNMRKLKTSIRLAEETVRRYRFSQRKLKFLKDYPRKSLSKIVISKVNKKYLATKRIPYESVLSKEDDCPSWLLVVAEGYSAIGVCFEEIKEELQIICNKFIKQETYYLNMCNRRYNRPPDKYAEEIKKEEEIAFKRLVKKTENVAVKMVEHAHTIKDKKAKEEELKEVKAEIEEEIQHIKSRYESINDAIETESISLAESEERLKRYQNVILEKKKMFEELNQELHKVAKNQEEKRISRHLSLSIVSENKDDLFSACALSMAEMLKLKAKISELEVAKQKYPVSVEKLRAKLENIKKKINDGEREEVELLDELDILSEMNSEILDQKKRQQEAHQSLVTNRNEKNRICLETLYAKTRILEETKLDIFEKKKKFIVPFKLQLKEWRDHFKAISVECHVIYETSNILIEEQEILKKEQLELSELRRKMQSAISGEMQVLSKLRESLDYHPMSATSLREYEYTDPLKKSKSTSQLSLRESNSSSSLNSLWSRSSETSAETEERDILDECRVATLDNIDNMPPANLYRIKKLRERESQLYDQVSNMCLQVDPLEQATVLLSLAYLSKFMEIRSRWRNRRRMSAMSRCPKGSAVSRRRLSAISCASSGYTTPRRPTSKRSPSPPQPKAFIDINSRELHSQFSKLLFL